MYFGVCVSLLGAGISAGLFLWQVFHWELLPAFIGENTIEPLEQLRIVLIVIGCDLLVFGLALVYCFLRRGRGVLRNLYNLGRMLRPLWLLFFLPVLFHKTIGRSQTVFLLLVLVGFAVVLYGLVARHSFGDTYVFWRRSFLAAGASALVGVLILGYVVYFSYYTILHHYQLGTSAFDLGLIENALLNTTRGDFMRVSYFSFKSLFSVHFAPVYLLWFPFYWAVPYTETLLILHSLTIGVAAWPLYLLARRKLGSDWLGLLVVFRSDPSLD